MVSATHAGATKGVNPSHLSKIWKISQETAERTLEVVTQHNMRAHDPKLSRNYGTNDRMLRYKRINSFFVMDTFFATKKAGQFSHGNSCCQLFVPDKDFVYVVPMAKRDQVL